MPRKNTNPARDIAARHTNFVPQAIVCAIALGIMGVGAWSLTGQTAPYHPDYATDAVTRGDGPDLLGFTD